MGGGVQVGAAADVDLSGVVRIATTTISPYPWSCISKKLLVMYLHSTLQAQPVVFDGSLGRAVVTIDPGDCVLELWGHGLAFDAAVELAELHLHVDNAAATDGAAVGSFHVLVVAEVVNAVAAAHENNGLWGGEHVFAADGTVAVGGSFDATVGISN